jgi:hypothetical protein
MTSEGPSADASREGGDLGVSNDNLGQGPAPPGLGAARKFRPAIPRRNIGFHAEGRTF